MDVMVVLLVFLQKIKIWPQYVAVLLLLSFSSAADTLKILGSTTLKPVMDHINYIVNGDENVFLASPALDNLTYVHSTLSDSFKQRVKQHFNGMRFSIRPGGSTLGVRAVLMGNAQIGLVSRHLTDEELEQLDKLAVFLIGYDALVFITDVDNSVKQISSYELR